MTLNNSMLITPLPPAKVEGTSFEHGSGLDGKTRGAWVNSQWKSTFLRKIAERSVAGLMNALQACADIFKPVECENYFKASGYDTD